MYWLEYLLTDLLQMFGKDDCRMLLPRTVSRQHSVRHNKTDCLMVTTSKTGKSMEETEESEVRNSSLQNIVPPCPLGLSINKTDFLKQDFSVDNFFIEVEL